MRRHATTATSAALLLAVAALFSATGCAQKAAGPDALQVTYYFLPG